MRRGINIRKRKKIIFKELNKKSLKLLTLLIIGLILCTIAYIFFIQDIFIKDNLKQDSLDFSKLNENIPFSISKIILFSSATANSGTINQLLSLDISQYCDIGIYLNTQKNSDASISSLYIDNITVSKPELGIPYLYKKTVPDLGKCTFEEKHIINDRLDFKIINTDDTINYLKYELYCDGSSPISLGFYNKDIIKDFLPDKQEILYDGTLLKDASIPLTSLNCSITFTINIVTTLNEHYVCNVNLDIPFENSENSIYTDGYITQEFTINDTNKFIRIQ